MRVTLTILLSFSVIFCYGTSYFVSSSSGHKNNDGLSALHPKKLIQEAADLTKPGDTVFVMNGTYSNDCPTCNVVNIPVSGKAGEYIVYTNYKSHKPTIRFDGWGGISIRDGISYIKISGFEVIGNNAKVTLKEALKQPGSCANTSGTYDPKFNGNGIVIDGRNGKHPHHIVIENNTVHDCGGGGISAIQTDYITVENNLVYNTSFYSVFATSGISFYQFWNYDQKKGYHNVIKRNKCYNNKSLVPWFQICKLEDGNGIIIDDFENKQNGSVIGRYLGRTLIENNVCWYNGGTGIHAFQSSQVDIINNTAYRNSQTRPLNAGEILAVSSHDIRIVNNILVADKNNRINSNYKNTSIAYQNNLHYNITTPDKIKISISSPSCINGKNPNFELPKHGLDASFALQKKSPAINRANQNLYSNSDQTGKIRVKGKPADIGAYEAPD
ncbi:right-handed parallel beta-helix repeat-containing protein [Pedobacter frigoris]|uniref:right-handed parallel beta-helix repeat-containing protein n=1 Tax=Pedobacter frigoris TaxID=2571272 RepID=UPI00293033B4|nr:right-handed parallel beta-helix repeat-containing protein [Pedobacter frigoris]